MGHGRGSRFLKFVAKHVIEARKSVVAVRRCTDAGCHRDVRGSMGRSSTMIATDKRIPWVKMNLFFLFFIIPLHPQTCLEAGNKYNILRGFVFIFGKQKNRV